MFYEILLNKQKNKLIFRMRIFNRILSFIFFVSVVIAMLLPGSLNEIKNYYIYQYIFFAIIFILLFFASFYKDTYVFDKDTEEIKIMKGLIFLWRSKKYYFKDLNSIYLKKIFKKRGFLNINIKDEYVYTLGFKISGKYFILENRMDEIKANKWVELIHGFFPYEIKESDV
ncbi:MAG TPA: hypothetical protein PLN45_02985 [Exilispira sp.]|nr:hypothetical protein [Exilispira sp.]